MTILNRLYASSGSEVLLDTIEIRTSDEVFHLVSGFENLVARTEGGEDVEFIACGMSVALPARNADGTQDLKFAISNITGEASGAIRRALKTGAAISVIYRCYISADMSAPAKPPYRMSVKGGTWTALEVQIVAGYMNILDMAWPRERFTLANAPGLRYLG